MASDWMFNNGLDDDEEVSSKHMSRKKAKRVRDISKKSKYGGYVYDSDDRKAAQDTLGSEYWE